MLTPVGTFINGIATALESSIVLPCVGIALILAGIYWMFTRSEHGKEKAVAALMGGALAFMGPSLAAALSGGIPH